MSRILILGGYGGFGARITRRLAAAGHELIVAGRSEARARRFCAAENALAPAPALAGRGDRIPLVALGLDRAALGPALAVWRPALVIDASGPFQGMDHQVPRACIAAGVSYCDIADGREFVCGIAGLDAAARDAGVMVIAGASSVPALSGAVVRALAADLDRVRSVEIAISASRQATGGPAVTAAVLAQIGRPFTRRQGQRDLHTWGWQTLQSMAFEIPGRPPLTGRLVASLDVPDLALLPHRLPGRPAVSFRAGAGSRLQNLAVAMLAQAVRLGWVRQPGRATPLLTRLQKAMPRPRDDRSAMSVRLVGDRAGQSLERRWTLIAERGHGPEIPALSAPLIAERILAGKEAPGARDAGDALALEDFGAAFAGLALHQWTETLHRPAPLYARLLGTDFARLPPAVRALHDVQRDGGATGEAVVGGADKALGRLIARFMGFPPTGPCALHVAFQEHEGTETWERDFGGRRFLSRLSQDGDRLTERFGPLRFQFDLKVDAQALTMVMRGWTAFGIPLPLAWAPHSRAREWEADDRYQFDVEIGLPVVGRLVAYRGWLQPLGTAEQALRER